MNTQSQVVVVGAGIVGVSTALHLLMRGMKVLLIDRVGAGRETSYGNSGIIETSYVLPFSLPPYKRIPGILLNHDTAVQIHYPSLPSYVLWIIDFYLKSKNETRIINGQRLRPLVVSALDEHRHLMLHTDAARHLSLSGRIKLHRNEASYLEGTLERLIAREVGVPFDVIDAKAIHDIEPHLMPNFYKAIRWSESARLTNPGAVVEAYMERFVREGGQYLHANVQQLEPTKDNHWLVRSNTKPFETHNVVLCTGPWSPKFYKSLGYRFPFNIKRGYHQHFKAIGAASLTHAITDADFGYLLCPMEQGLRLTTGAEFAKIDVPPNPSQIARILPFAREIFPLGDAVDETIWLGSRPCFADSLPVIGKAPRHQGLWFNFGHGHSGLTIGPSSGRLLAEMMTGQPTLCDPYPYRPERFRV